MIRAMARRAIKPHGFMSSRPSPITSQRHKLTLLVVDRSELFQAGLKYVIGKHEGPVDIQIVGEAHSVATALSLNSRLKPDIVILDPWLPDGSGFEVCRAIRAHHPNTKVLILTSASDDDLVHEALNTGAHGYLLKEIGTKSLLQAIIDVAVGKFILDPALTTRVLNLVRRPGPSPAQGKLAKLSAQQKHVLALVAEGKSNKEIAAQMGLSDKTVKNYLSNAFDKLKIKRRAQAAIMYLQHQKQK